jgi:hypothetical protein
MTTIEKIQIAKNIKNISLEDAIKDFQKLQKIDIENTTSLARTGLKWVDFYTYPIRLDTVGSKGISFYTFVEDFEKYHKIPCVSRLYDKLREKHPANFHKCVKEIFQLYYGTINAFRPIVALKIYDRYKPKNILNVCSGWSGMVIAAAALNIPKITAIDNNSNLFKPYTNMIEELKKYSKTEINFINNNALILDLSNNSYDMVISSPPYYNKEIYGYLPAPYDTKKEWNESFYKPLFRGMHELLEVNGKLVINVPQEIYDACLVPLFGEAHELILLPKYQRNNKYKEYIYVWIK